MNYILDTNVFVRYIIGDHKEHQKQAVQWFLAAERGTINILVLPAVIAETVYVLQSWYRQPREQIADAMEVFLSQRWLEVQDRDALLDLWQSYRAGLHFIDSYLIALSKESDSTVLTFDKKLKKRSH